MNDMQKVALVAGASGLVGQRLVTVLCEAREYSRVYALTRRPLTRDHQKLANRVVRFADLEMQLRGITCSEAFCCLGTTRRKPAPRRLSGKSISSSYSPSHVLPARRRRSASYSCRRLVPTRTADRSICV